MEINFCRRCGSKLEDKGNGTYRCEKGHHVYYKSWPAAAVVLVNDKNEVLLTVRGIDPDKGMLDVGGGFCNWAEQAEVAAHREVEEELGLTPDQYGPIEYLSCGIDWYVYEGEEQPVLAVFYWARLTQKVTIRPSDDVADAMWVPLADVDFDKFPKKALAVRDAIKKLQNKVLVD
jgi:NAD+ diphosphatase